MKSQKKKVTKERKKSRKKEKLAKESEKSRKKYLDIQSGISSGIEEIVEYATVVPIITWVLGTVPKKNCNKNTEGELKLFRQRHYWYCCDVDPQQIEARK